MNMINKFKEKLREYNINFKNEYGFIIEVDESSINKKEVSSHLASWSELTGKLLKPFYAITNDWRYPNKIIECNYFSYTDDSGDVWEELSFFESLNKSYPFVSLSTLIIASENNDKLENYLFLK